jgi:pimeloyl-ACP methyl ester carboxylesterase
VLFDQRGTGEGHDLACRMSGSDDNLQGYLEPMFQVPLLRACRSELEKKADLTQYTTPVASADLDEVRRALRYDKIYMTGASYGARAILDYVRRYGKHVRGVVMTSVQPPSIKNPLFLPRAAEDAINGLLAACDSDPACKAAYADVRGDLAAVRSALAAQPARVSVRHPATGAPASILLSERAFVEALRVMLYSAEGARRVPLLLARARQGDLAPFAEAAVASNRALRNQIKFGMLLSVLCNEDMARTSEAEIDRETAGTLLGADRVRQQQAVCSEWPRAKVPADYARPFRSNVPAVIVSGDLDPATSRQAGVEMGRFFPDHIHLVVPGGHSPTNACLQSIGEAFFDSPSLKGLDTSCVGTLRPPPFALPQPGAAP